MVKPKYKRGPAVQVDKLEKSVKTIDTLISSGRLHVDMLQGAAAMDSYLWLYYNQSDKMMQGFCLMLRTWINFQRAWKKGELLRLLNTGFYEQFITQETSGSTSSLMADIPNRVSPPTLPLTKILTATEEQKHRYMDEYIRGRYCPWPDAAPLLVVCIDSEGKAVCSVEQSCIPSSLNYCSNPTTI